MRNTTELQKEFRGSRMKNNISASSSSIELSGFFLTEEIALKFATNLTLQTQYMIDTIATVDLLFT